ncbi:hypothetical protein [Planobispora takensis]|uniref:hypothetical protein n=1 Tax=Planobispora takensis TaxID=1367882 RepID=UPI0019450843|nr:hypothetical protein [Planobispora takensis]
MPYPAGVYRDRLSAGRVLAAVVRGYGRWVARAPETRGLASGLAALYPAGELMHALGPEPLLVGALAPPLAISAWVGTYKAHRSVKYSAALTATVAAVPGWLAFAAGWGAFNLPTLVGYTSTAALAWSAFTWSDVLRERRAWQEQQLKWDTLAATAGLEGSRLIGIEQTRLGPCFRIDVRRCDKTASQLTSGVLAERLAAELGLAKDQVSVREDARHAGILRIQIHTLDPWTQPAPALALTGATGESGSSGALVRRSVLDRPLQVGDAPDTGQAMQLVLYNHEGGHHTFVVAPTGAGKTTFYNAVIDDLSGCTDVLIWGIDLFKGTIPALWGPVLDASAGIGEYDKALAILEWAYLLIKERSRKNGGLDHVPTPTEPLIVIFVDEQDELTGMHSPIAHKARFFTDKIHTKGRSAAVVLLTASQRGVIQHTGSKEAHFNAQNKIVLRINRITEMANVVPEWEAAGMPNMVTYRQGTKGVILIVDAANQWRAGRFRNLSDFRAVKQLAAARGGPAATLDADLVPLLVAQPKKDQQQAYADRHATDPGSTTPASLPAPPAGTGHPAAEGWGVDPADSGAVDRLARHLVTEIETNLAGMPDPPRHPTRIEDLLAAKQLVEHTDVNDPAVNRAITVPEHITRAILRLLAQRGEAGARRDELVAAVGKSRSGVANWLAILRDHHVIVAAGAGKAARYYLPEYAPALDDDDSAGDY